MRRPTLFHKTDINFVDLMAHEGALVLAQLDACDRGSLRRCCRALRGHVDRAIDAVTIVDRHADALADSGLLSRLPRLSTVMVKRRITWRSAPLSPLPLTKLLLALRGHAVTSFTLCGSGRQIPTTSFAATAALALTRLTSLTWLAPQLGLDDPLLLGTMTQLHKLQLENVLSVDSVDVAALKSLTQLTQLKFVHYEPDEFGHDQVLEWGAVLPHLALLEVCSISAASFDAILMLGALPKLRSLELWTHPNPDVAGLMDAARLPAASFPALTSFDLRVFNIAGADVPKLEQAVSRMAAMTELKFKSNFDGSCCCLPATLQPTALQSLSICLEDDFSPTFDNAFLVQLAKRLPRLEQLELSVNKHCASDAGFIAAAVHFQRLRTLKFCQYSNHEAADEQPVVTAASALSLATRVPSLISVSMGGGTIKRAHLDQGAQLLREQGHRCLIHYAFGS